MGKLPPVEPANVAELTQILKHGKQPEGKDAVVRYENKSFVDIADEALDPYALELGTEQVHYATHGTGQDLEPWGELKDFLRTVKRRKRI